MGSPKKIIKIRVEINELDTSINPKDQWTKSGYLKKLIISNIHKKEKFNKQNKPLNDYNRNKSQIVTCRASIWTFPPNGIYYLY